VTCAIYFSIVAVCLAGFALRGYQDLLWRVTELEDREERRRRREKSSDETTLTEEQP
jgi:hypothetical protein